MEKIAATLFGKTRQAVLTALFEQPARRFYVRELARHSGISVGALQSELSALVEADLITREKDGNRVLYQANSTSQVFGEIRSLVLKTCGIPVQIRRILEPFGDAIRYATIYGSVAKGNNQSRSDVDLLVVGDIPYEKLLEALHPLEDQFGREISVRLFGPMDFSQRLAQQDRFLVGILQGPKLKVIGEMDGFGQSGGQGATN
jgi:predicted nucleotidyltransferase